MEQVGGVQQNAPLSKSLFTAARREWHLSIQNKMGVPYDVAHNATANRYARNLQQEKVDAIENLVRSTVSDRAAIAQLMVTVARLTTDISRVNTKLVVALQTNSSRWGVREGRNITSREKGPAAGAGAGTDTGARVPARTGAGTPTMAEEKDLEQPIHYCWTYGPS